MLKVVFCMLGVGVCFNSWVLSVSILMLLTFLSLMLLGGFNMGLIDYMLVDNLSYLLVVLSLWIGALMFMASYYVANFNKNKSMFTILVLLMTTLLLITFSGSNLMLFYIMFESTLIPIFLLVMGWGYQPERISASYYLLFYTLFASLPLLLGLLYLSSGMETMNYYLLGESTMKLDMFIVLSLIVAFLVKMPLYFGHLWLPKAHVEAPVAGSMVLAGLLLKLGGYGLVRVLPVISFSISCVTPWVLAVSLFGGLASSLICLRQVDSKSLVAYSSVAHMSLVVVGLFLMSESGWWGAILIMVAHGLCSSGLFALVGLVYSRINTRSMFLMRSSVATAPLLALWWFLFSISNMAAPPTPNLAGEILIFLASVKSTLLMAILVGVISFMAAAYNLYLFSTTQHGSIAYEVNSSEEASYCEHLLLSLHFVPLLLALVPLMNMT